MDDDKDVVREKSESTAVARSGPQESSPSTTSTSTSSDEEKTFRSGAPSSSSSGETGRDEQMTGTRNDATKKRAFARQKVTTLDDEGVSQVDAVRRIVWERIEEMCRQVAFYAGEERDLYHYFQFSYHCRIVTTSSNSVTSSHSHNRQLHSTSEQGGAQMAARSRLDTSLASSPRTSKLSFSTATNLPGGKLVVIDNLFPNLSAPSFHQTSEQMRNLAQTLSLSNISKDALLASFSCMLNLPPALAKNLAKNCRS